MLFRAAQRQIKFPDKTGSAGIVFAPRSDDVFTGFDRLVDGEGAMRWKFLGIVPVMTASGPDISRSAAGRVEAESVWLPSVLCGEDVAWTAPTG